MNIGLHRDKKDLYAVIVPNTKTMTKQRWKVIDYKYINAAFMTADQLKATYGIYSADLPKGSKAEHKDWTEEKHRIVIEKYQTKKLIRKTFQGKRKIHIISSTQNHDRK